MPCDSILEIPKAVPSDDKTTKDPYVADLYYEARRRFYQREKGTPELVASARITRCLSPNFGAGFPGKLNENKPNSDTSTLDT
jgi:hypothetical protein